MKTKKLLHCYLRKDPHQIQRNLGSDKAAELGMTPVFLEDIGLEALIEKIIAGEIKDLYAFDHTRFAREEIEALLLDKKVKEYGVTVHYASKDKRSFLH